MQRATWPTTVTIQRIHLAIVSWSILCSRFAVAESPIWSATPPDPQQVARWIDDAIEVTWNHRAVVPHDRADDATLVRRLHLDLVGRIPMAGEARQFVDATNDDKYLALTSRLLHSDAHRTQMARIWRRTWLPQSDELSNYETATIFERWLVAQQRRGLRYDDLVRATLVPPPTTEDNSLSYSAAQAFARAHDHAAPRLAATTARAFLGINLDCAQCHDHPFARWSRQQFWQTAAFFERPSRDAQGVARFTIKDDAQQVVAARFLDQSQDAPLQSTTGHEGPSAVSDWMISPSNPFFARNAVNRLWAQFFGVGLVEPLDDLTSASPSPTSDLLDRLAETLIASGFDTDLIVHAIVLSRPYQLSSADRMPPTRAHDLAARSFASMPVRSLTGEQLYDSRRIASGRMLLRADLDSAELHEERKHFVSAFRADHLIEGGRSITQTLQLLNGREALRLLDGERTPTLGAIQDVPFLSSREKVEGLYWATLSRTCTEEEWIAISRFLEHEETCGSLDTFYADLFSTLLNTAEFNCNH